MIREMIEHAKEEFPLESCGVIVDGKYCPEKNVHENPTKSFRLSREAWTYSTYPGEAKLEGIVHSHPNGPEYPSSNDMVSQIASAVPWCIVPVYARSDDSNETIEGEPFWFGDQLLAPPLLGRKFRHGVTDCYSLIRDWYKLNRGIDLNEIPRDWNWWDKGQNLYMIGFPKAGFEEVAVNNNPAVGDVALVAIGSSTINHAGVYIGHEKIMHHPANRRGKGYDETSLSRIDSIHPYMSRIQRWIRYMK